MTSKQSVAHKIEISHRTIIFTVLLLIGVWAVTSIWKIILQILIALIIMTALNPLVNRLEKSQFFSQKTPRAVAAMLIYILIFLAFSLFVTLFTQPFITQTTSLILQFPKLFSSIELVGIDQSVLQSQLNQIGNLPAEAIKLVGNIFSNILGFFSTIVVSFYLILERKRLHIHLVKLFDNPDMEKQVELFLDSLEDRLGGWVRAEIILMTIVGLLTYFGLVLLQVPFAFPLAIIAGLLELIPNIGPIISSIPAIIIALAISPWVSLGVVSLYIFVQLLENHLIVPQVMSKTVGVNPLVTILVLLVGFELAGVMGAVLGVPVVLFIQTILQHFVFHPIKIIQPTNPGTRKPDSV